MYAKDLLSRHGNAQEYWLERGADRKQPERQPPHLARLGVVRARGLLLGVEVAQAAHLPRGLDVGVPLLAVLVPGDTLVDAALGRVRAAAARCALPPARPASCPPMLPVIVPPRLAGCSGLRRYDTPSVISHPKFQAGTRTTSHHMASRFTSSQHHVQECMVPCTPAKRNCMQNWACKNRMQERKNPSAFTTGRKVCYCTLQAFAIVSHLRARRPRWRRQRPKAARSAASTAGQGPRCARWGR